MKGKRQLLNVLLILACLQARAQQFYNLTAQEVRIDSVLPLFTYQQDLGPCFADSVYTVSIDYPEFIDVSPADVARLQHLLSHPLKEMPTINQYIGISRKRGRLFVSFVPLVCREGKYRKLVSFKLTVRAHASARSRVMKTARTTQRYAEHSVLASGRWAKIRVPSTGIYQLTDELIRRAGFTDLNKVKVYGYGGAVQPEKLTTDYLSSTDDLKEVATCVVGEKRLFYAVGPVTWSSRNALQRTQNPYSSYGYYFLTQNDAPPFTVSEKQFKTAHYPSADDYHSLYEIDDFAWYSGGRRLFDGRLFGTGVSRSYPIEAPEGAKGQLLVSLTCNGSCEAEILMNDSLLGTLKMTTTLDRYTRAREEMKSFVLNSPLSAANTVTVRQLSGGKMRLDYISLAFDRPRAWPELAQTRFNVPEYVGNIMNQDHHADAAADMVIIIPPTRKLLSEAERLKTFHEHHDLMRVRIVPADELYNEYSSGTPDANAYRRYLKMLYDRAVTDADMPRFLLLFGDGAWDNRMLSSDWKNQSPDDFLLCYESDNSFSAIDCYVSDDYFCLMDDEEGGNLESADQPDIAVGRFPVRTLKEAGIMVDKSIGYMNNSHAGAWQNTICFMGDDGDSNRHMKDAESVAGQVEKEHPDFLVKRIYWDAYTRKSSSTGFSYPDVTQLIKEQMQKGALIMNYSGHGAAYTLSHEKVVDLGDFAAATSQRLPLWVTASCDIMPFDGQEGNIGETAVLNRNGGAVAFYGTTRTVYAHYNGYMNRAFMRYVLAADDNNKRYAIGEAARLAKNLLMTSTMDGNDIGQDKTTNKLQYTLLGDPALTLAVPTIQAVVDSIDGQDAASVKVQMLVGKPVVIKGHITGAPTFKGVVTITVHDIEKTITCLQNASSTADPFVFKDRPNMLYMGSDSVRNGVFTVTFALPKDISYTDGTGLITVYAVNNEKTLEAHGGHANFTMGGDAVNKSDGMGPNIYCYLNSGSFVNGGTVNTTPLFHAELYDKNGLNVSGNGVGHDLELIVDGEMVRTYSLNDHFQYDFGDYCSGSLNYSIPALAPGQHRLVFRAWDLLNNASTVELQFNVEKGVQPSVATIDCTPNPAVNSTTFYISHDRMGSNVNVEVEVFDLSGRQLWKHTASGVASSQVYTVNWDLTTGGGHRLETGVYLYRVLLSSDGSKQTSNAKKLIILKK